MTKTITFTLVALALFLLYLIFGNAAPIYKIGYVAAAIFGCVVFYRVKTSYTLDQNARLSLDDIIKQNNLKPEYKHFFSFNNLVSGVAIGRDDTRILLQSGKLPAKLFHRAEVLSVKTLTTGERSIEITHLNNSIESFKALERVEVFVKDLDNPCYRLYFENVELMRQWESRLTAWLHMHAVEK